VAILKGILSTNLGITAYNSVNVTSKFLLKPFVQKLTSNRSSTVVLTYDEVTFFAWAGLSIKRRAYVVLELSSLGTDQPDDTGFEEWICSVTIAIILC
jgi:hypothetical protein